jgi:hypothetical protein
VAQWQPQAAIVSRLRFWSLALAACCLLPAAPVAAQSAPPCTFTLSFQALHAAVAGEVGDCRGNRQADANGDAWQLTSKGMLVWRNAENWTAFVGANHSVLLTADGVARRLNTDRFDWELGGIPADAGMFGDPGSGLIPAAMAGPGFAIGESGSSDSSASSTLVRNGTDRFRGSRNIVQTVQVLPSPELAHSLFLDLANLQQGDLLLKTTQLGDETQVIAWKPDDVSAYGATFRQLLVRARRSNAVVTVVLVPGTRLDYAVQLASTIFGRLR